MEKQREENGRSPRKRIVNILVHVFLAVLAVIWVMPIFWIVLTSFRAEPGAYTSTFLPKAYTLNNYVKLLTDRNVLNFPRMFKNTLIFPGFMTMIAQYFILKAMGLTEGSSIRFGLIIVYSACTGLGFQISKGFFDTIPRAIDEAAIIDGATQWQIFTKITMPLSKPIVIYTIMTSFIAPWVDFIFAKVLCRANADQFTVAIGLWNMLQKEYIYQWYTCFAAGAVLISLPIAILFLYLQRFYVEGMSGAVKG